MHICSTQAELSSVSIFHSCSLVYIRGPETNYSRSNIYDGNMTAQWSGKMRNVQDFDHAFTDVSSRPYLFRNAKTKITVRLSGRDRYRVSMDALRSFSL